MVLKGRCPVKMLLFSDIISTLLNFATNQKNEFRIQLIGSFGEIRLETPNAQNQRADMRLIPAKALFMNAISSTICVTSSTWYIRKVKGFFVAHGLTSTVLATLYVTGVFRCAQQQRVLCVVGWLEI
ncbi:hypothetical protein IV203_032893 [Nitzschia inconspicua]|uniref:Uncharacterized protein n=1 Tax=Nitzschia inconspicua TaxID=303405 RepID=A0A9K3KKF7_9STRA|nr:hypothetical protein IV203_032893 [Nitzschia inconspicua]